MKLLGAMLIMVFLLVGDIDAENSLGTQDLYASQMDARFKEDIYRHHLMSKKPRHGKIKDHKEQRRAAMEKLVAMNETQVGKNATDDSHPYVKFPMYMGADFGVFEYLVDIELGTPPQKLKLIVDTGSDLTWANCTFMENKDSGIDSDMRPFNAERSSTFKTITCDSRVCSEQLSSLFSLAACSTPADPCTYDYRYMENSAVIGKFGKEKIYLPLTNGTQSTLLNVVGCTENLEGAIVKGGDGVLGMGYNQQSFGYRTATKLGNGKFSYCLVDTLSNHSVTGYLTIGEQNSEETKIVGKMRYTELILGVTADMYAVWVKGISIGETMLDIPSEVWDVAEDAGTIMDSGSSLTFLYRPIYDAVTGALAKALSQHLEQVPSPRPMFEYCFNSTGFQKSMVPRLVFHFEDGARFKPHVKGYFLDYKSDIKCIAFLPTDHHESVIGNFLQQNYVWEYDLFRGKLGFAPSTCY